MTDERKVFLDAIEAEAGAEIAAIEARRADIDSMGDLA